MDSNLEQLNLVSVLRYINLRPPFKGKLESVQAETVLNIVYCPPACYCHPYFFILSLCFSVVISHFSWGKNIHDTCHLYTRISFKLAFTGFELSWRDPGVRSLSWVDRVGVAEDLVMHRKSLTLWRGLLVDCCRENSYRGYVQGTCFFLPWARQWTDRKW